MQRRLALTVLLGLTAWAVASAPAGAAVDWHHIHEHFETGIYNGYLCDDYGSGANACTTAGQNPQTARWVPGPGRLLWVGVFKPGAYLSGYAPGGGGDDKFVVTSGQQPFAGGESNVVSGSSAKAGDRNGPLRIRVDNIKNFVGVHLGYKFDVDGYVTTDRPDRESSLTCQRQSLEVTQGESVNQLAVCSAPGHPLPTVRVAAGGHFPDGISFSRFPSDTDPWVVLDGTFTKPGTYEWRFTDGAESQPMKVVVHAAKSARAQLAADDGVGDDVEDVEEPRFVDETGGFGPDTIASWFEELVKEKGTGWITDQIGLDTSAKDMEEIKAKLDAIDRHINAIGEQLNAAILNLQFKENVDAANAQINQLHATYQNRIVPLANDALAYKKAKAADDKAGMDKWKAEYERDKEDFAKVQADQGQGFASRVEAVHLIFMPGSGAPGLIGTFGQKLLANKRYLTTRDSQRQDAVYAHYEEYQALAAWLTAEWEIARGHPELIERVAKEFRDDTAAQRNPANADGLPPDLPRGTTLDRGPYDATHIDSLHKTLAASVTGPNEYWQASATDDPLATPNIIKRVNAAKLGGFNDWQAPSQDEILSLLAGRTAGISPADHLRNIGLPVDDPRGLLWTRDVANPSVAFGQFEHRPFPVHEAISLQSGSPTEWPPHLNQRGPYSFGSEVEFDERLAHAQLFVDRSTGETRYFG